jgi:tetratricopeptide (TPR) repeat protein
MPRGDGKTPDELSEPSDESNGLSSRSLERQGTDRAGAPSLSTVKATARIFLSYAREDKEKVESLYQKLSDAGFKPWMDTRDILPGERWQTSIRKAIRHSDFFLVCLSKSSAGKRGWVQREIREALDIWQEMLDSDIYLIPVRLEDCEAPDRLRDFQWVDLFEEDGWTRLVRAIQAGMERRAEEESTPSEPHPPRVKPFPGRVTPVSIEPRREEGLLPSRPRPRQMGAWLWVTVAVLGLAAIGGFAFALLRPDSSKATPTAGTMATIAASIPTLTSTPPAPTSTPPPALPLSPTTWPTPTPKVPLPLPVALQTQGCAEEKPRFEEDIQADGTLVDQDSVVRIEIVCDGGQATIGVTLPPTPAYTIEFLSEEGPLEVSTEVAYGRPFVRAVVAYARGDYAAALSELRQTEGRLTASDAYLLRAMILMHLERWDEAREAYSTALERLPAEEAGQRAQAYAGRGLAYLLEGLAGGFRHEETLAACREKGLADYDQALALQPDNALWLAGRGLVRLECPEKDNKEAIKVDVEAAVKQAQGTETPAEAMALALAARLALMFDGDIPLAIDTAQQAMAIDPTLPGPYALLGSLYADMGDSGQALEAYRNYASTAVLSWQRANALQHLAELP